MNIEHYNSSDWDKKFLSDAYCLLKRRYYKVELLDGLDYKINDIGGAK